MVLKFAVLLAKQLMLFIILYEVLANAGYVEFIESVFLMSAYSGKSLLIAETQLLYFIYNVFSKCNWLLYLKILCLKLCARSWS